MTRTPVTGADVSRAVDLTANALREAPAEDWARQAGPMGCDCWDALDHLNNGLFSYALRLAPQVPYLQGRPTIVWQRPGEQPLPIITDRESGPEAGIEALLMMGGLVAAVVDARPPTAAVLAHLGHRRPRGLRGDGRGRNARARLRPHAGAEGAVRGAGRSGGPGAGAAVPEAPQGTDPWATMLWATGRGELEGRERVSPDWQWHGAPLDEAPA